MTDLLAATAALVDVASPSFGEGPLADRIEAELRSLPWLTVDRVEDNVVARTTLGRPTRLEDPDPTLLAAAYAEVSEGAAAPSRAISL